MHFEISTSSQQILLGPPTSASISPTIVLVAPSISLPGVINEYLRRYQFTTRPKRTTALKVYVDVSYGQHVIAPIPIDTTPLLSSTRTTRLQSILGSLLHYARVVDATMLCAVLSTSSLPLLSQRPLRRQPITSSTAPRVFRMPHSPSVPVT